MLQFINRNFEGDMMDTKMLRKGFGAAAGKKAQIAAYHKACNDAADEIDRLHHILDSRPAINAASSWPYVEWSADRGIFVRKVDI